MGDKTLIARARRKLAGVMGRQEPVPPRRIPCACGWQCWYLLDDGHLECANCHAHKTLREIDNKLLREGG